MTNLTDISPYDLVDLNPEKDLWNKPGSDTVWRLTNKVTRSPETPGEKSTLNTKTLLIGVVAALVVGYMVLK